MGLKFLENRFLFLLECKKDVEEDIVISTRNKRETRGEEPKQSTIKNTASTVGNKVCIEYNGNIRQDGEIWIHSRTKDGLTTCVECICKVTYLHSTAIC